ncbi:hypothetical protein QVD17_36662 [Tagetes erecta]|uniref:Uncharacterized protein n=1 Tax=Tagetes erecta TaxID=13708 RepID=A0AAD8JV80_TARER|nr:hypothetical protein QVD17_36662 [Tagetes erecta]
MWLQHRSQRCRKAIAFTHIFCMYVQKVIREVQEGIVVLFSRCHFKTDLVQIDRQISLRCIIIITTITCFILLYQNITSLYFVIIVMHSHLSRFIN